VEGRGDHRGRPGSPGRLKNKPKRSEHPLIEIKLKRHEPVEKGLRRLKKQMLREGVIRELKKRRHYEKPSVTLRRKRKAASFEAMLRQRHADD
jgi:small subunit ribosomal protein S21